MAGLTAASLPASAQINARISPDLKARGDAASEERSGRAEAMRRGSIRPVLSHKRRLQTSLPVLPWRRFDPRRGGCGF